MSDEVRLALIGLMVVSYGWAKVFCMAYKHREESRAYVIAPLLGTALLAIIGFYIASFLGVFFSVSSFIIGRNTFRLDKQ